jgi:hypothetical protein
MPNRIQLPLPTIRWLLTLIAIVGVAMSLVNDLTGESAADQFILARGSFGALRIYLWLEGLVLAGAVFALGGHVISVGFAVSRRMRPNLFGMAAAFSPALPPAFGYVFVTLGAAMVVLSMTMVLALNYCRYMRLI